MKRQKTIWNDVEAVSTFFVTSSTIKDILVKMELPLTSANYRAIHRFADAHKLDIPVMSNEARSVAIKQSKEKFRPLNEEIFTEKSPFSRQMVKIRLLEEGLLEYKCYGEICQSIQLSLTNWEGLSLQLEHKNGIGDDNRIDNLEFLCPNCHSLTSTFGARNTARYEGRTNGVCKTCSRASKRDVCFRCLPPKKKLSGVSLESLLNDITERGIEEVSRSYEMTPGRLSVELRKRQDKITRLLPLADTGKYRKSTDYGDVNELAALVQKSSMLAVSKSLGVSDNALRKHLKKMLGLDHPLFNKKS